MTAAAGAARALGLTPEQTVHAIAISATANNALRVTRTGRLSNWKGLAFPNTAANAVNAAFLAKHGITGLVEVIEGTRGFKRTISGGFDIVWSNQESDKPGMKDERITSTIVKKFNAEIHSQAALEAVVELRDGYSIDPDRVERIQAKVFDVAYDIIGGGEEGDKTSVDTKEEADHSLPYLIAVALIDGEVTPSQFTEERIHRKDVQQLLRKVEVSADPEYSKKFPDAMLSQVRIMLDNGDSLMMEKRDYEGFHTRPATWSSAREKFDALTHGRLDHGQRNRILDMICDIESIPINQLMTCLRQTGPITDRPTL